MKKIMIFTDCDLDGVGSYLMFKWFTNFNTDVEISSISNFGKTFKTWANKKRIEDYDRVYILDLDVSQQYLDIIDKPNVTVIDHHDTHVTNRGVYKHAKTILQEHTSCCRLIYDLFRDKYPERKLSDNQKLLMLLVDDYDSYQLKIPDSYKLNVVLWNYVGNRLQQFERDFGSGFFGFNQSHSNIIHLNEKKVKRILSELQVFKGELPVGDVKYNIYSTMCTECLNEVAQHVIDSYDCDICMIVNPKTKRVSFRKNKKAVIDLSKLAQKIASGGGHKDSSGGKLTEQVLTLTTMLQPI